MIIYAADSSWKKNKKKQRISILLHGSVYFNVRFSVWFIVALFYLRHYHYIEVRNKPHFVKPMLRAIKRDFMGRIIFY